MTRTQHIQALRSAHTHSLARLFGLLASRSQCIQAGWPWMEVVSPRDIRREIATLRLLRGSLRGYGVEIRKE